MANALLEQHKDEIQETSEPEHVEPPVPDTRVDASQFEVKPRPYKKNLKRLIRLPEERIYL